MSELRHCDACGEDKPADAEHWHMRKGKDGIPVPARRRCKACENAAKAAHMRALRAAEEAEDPEAYRARLAEAQRAMRERRGDEWRAKQRKYSADHRRRQRGDQS